MKKLFVLTAALAFSFAVMAQCPGSVARAAAIKANAEKTCADWRAEGKCPKTENTTCADLRAAGKCPRANAQAAAAEAPKQGCARVEGQASCCSQTKVAEKTEKTRESRRAGNRKRR